MCVVCAHPLIHKEYTEQKQLCYANFAKLFQIQIAWLSLIEVTYGQNQVYKWLIMHRLQSCYVCTCPQSLCAFICINLAHRKCGTVGLFVNFPYEIWHNLVEHFGAELVWLLSMKKKNQSIDPIIIINFYEQFTKNPTCFFFLFFSCIPF